MLDPQIEPPTRRPSRRVATRLARQAALPLVTALLASPTAVHIVPAAGLACASMASCRSAPAPQQLAAKGGAEPSCAPPVGASPPASGVPSSGPKREAPPAKTETVAPAREPFIACTPLIRVDRSAGIVELEATAVLDTGFLEQFVCLKGTREHESLFVFEGTASEVHAAMLLAGCIAGSPGRWQQVEVAKGAGAAGSGVEVAREVASEVAIEGVAPTGSAVEVSVRLPDGTTRPVSWFVREAPLAEPSGRTPPSRFVFGGSRFVVDKRTGATRYLADSSGSLVGLVTFGDETVGTLEVLPDQASVAAPIWEAWTERMPRPGTTVTIVLRCTR